jgi:hypothetical protein
VTATPWTALIVIRAGTRPPRAPPESHYTHPAPADATARSVAETFSALRAYRIRSLEDGV